MEIRFYHLQRSTIDQALPSLLEKAHGQGMRSVVAAADEVHVRELDTLLWTYRPDSFLPHGVSGDDHARDQPILLASSLENPNKATVLFLLDARDVPDGTDFTLCCQLFDGNDEDAVSAARQRWKTLKDAGHDLTYWQQGEGGWEKKA